jgi:hypothetical protein
MQPNPDPENQHSKPWPSSVKNNSNNSNGKPPFKRHLGYSNPEVDKEIKKYMANYWKARQISQLLNNPKKRRTGSSAFGNAYHMERVFSYAMDCKWRIGEDWPDGRAPSHKSKKGKILRDRMRGFTENLQQEEESRQEAVASRIEQLAANEGVGGAEVVNPLSPTDEDNEEEDVDVVLEEESSGSYDGDQDEDEDEESLLVNNKKPKGKRKRMEEGDSDVDDVDDEDDDEQGKAGIIIGGHADSATGGRIMENIKRRFLLDDTGFLSDDGGDLFGDDDADHITDNYGTFLGEGENEDDNYF